MREGLPHIPEVKDVALDPTNKNRPPERILRHSVPKQFTNDEAVYEVTVSFSSVDCSVLKETLNQDNPCKPCSSALKAINRSNRLKARSAAIPAKDKAPLAACGS